METIEIDPLTREEKTDLVWLPLSLCKKVKAATDAKAIEREIVKYVEETKENMRIDIESMDEDIVQYRAYMIKARDAFKKAKDEELAAFYGLWEEYDKDLGKVRQYVTKAKEELKPFLEELQKVKSEINKIDTWGIEKLGDAISKLSSLHGQSKEMVEFLLKNYKKEENGNKL